MLVYSRALFWTATHKSLVVHRNVAFGSIPTEMGGALLRCLSTRPDFEGDGELESGRSFVGGSSSFQCSTDCCLRRFVLVRDSRPGHSKTSQTSAPQRIDVGYKVSRLMVLNYDVSQANPFKWAAELISVGKSENRVARGYVGWVQGWWKVSAAGFWRPRHIIPSVRQRTAGSLLNHFTLGQTN